MEKVLKSGAKIVVSMADFADANGLRKAVMTAVRGLPLGPNIMDVDMSVLKDALSDVGTSDAVERWMFQCAEKATYEGIPINRALFDDPKVGAQARKDYFEIAAAVAQENLAPFFETALTSLKTLIAKLKEKNESQPSK